MSKIMNGWLKSNYRAKECDLSVTDLTKPTFQLWVKMNLGKDIPRGDMTSFKSYLGSALHSAIEKNDEDGVVREFSWIKTLPNGIRIGGTCDELRWRYSINKWRLGDIKLKGTYVAKKFLEGGEEQKKEQMQLSTYRWLFDGMFDIEDSAVIYLFVQGHTSRDKFPEYQEVWLDLLPIHTVSDLVQGKIAVASNPMVQPIKDCPTWLCGYCEYSSVCPTMKGKTIEQPNHSFGDES